ncbi:MAG: hypothetical protein AAGH57_01325 [Pseudomonadota bacterium]
MMSGASFASLGPTLLARKGGAKPAMRPQLTPLPDDMAGLAALAEEQLEDLGWNDMGSEDAANDVADVESPLFPVKRAERTQTVLHSSNDPEWDQNLIDDTFDDEACEAAEDDNPAGPHPILDPLASADIVSLASHSAGRPPANEDTSHVQQTAISNARNLLADANAERAEALEADLPEIEVEGPLLREKRSVSNKKPKKSAKAASKARKGGARSQSKSGTGRRAAFTLRLDTDRHLKLRLAATMQGVSAQLLVTDALDALFDDIDELEALVERMKRT